MITTTDTPSDPTPAQKLKPRGFMAIEGLCGTDSPQILYIGTPVRPVAVSLQHEKAIHIVHLQPAAKGKDDIKDFLTGQGWSIVEHDLPLDDRLPAQSTVLVLDELFSPVLSNLRDDQHEAMRRLIAQNCRLVWVTMG
jgi:hypothetical protein